MTANFSESLILLAGGKGERAGMPKGLLTFNGRTLIRMQLERASLFGFSNIILALGFFAERYQDEVAGFRFPNLNVRLALNTEPELGQFRSIQAGLRLSGGDVFVTPLDTPLPEAKVFEDLRGRGKAAIPEIKGRGGHPVWLSRDFVIHLTNLSPFDEAARLDRQLHQLGSQCARVPVKDKRILMNVNTREEWEKSASLFMKGATVFPPEET